MTNIQGDNIILSTAAFCLWNISVQEKLEYCHQLGFNNVQIALSTIKMLETFKLSLGTIVQIRKFNNVSIHAPWCGIKYGDNIKTTQILDSLRSINQCTPVSRYVFNYDSILNSDALYNTGLKIMIRNPAKPDYWHKFRSTIQENKLSCVFDVNKAARNAYPIDTMIDEIQESVEEIHVSGFIDGKNRMPIISTKQEYLLRQLNRFNTKTIPIVIEGLFSPKDFHNIIAEKNLIMDYYKNVE